MIDACAARLAGPVLSLADLQLAQPRRRDRAGMRPPVAGGAWASITASRTTA